MNKRMKILLIAGAVMVLLLVAGYLKQQDRNSDGSQNSVTSIEAAIDDKTYTSKKAAYEAYANERRVSTTVLRVDLNLWPNTLSRRPPNRRMRSPHRSRRSGLIEKPRRSSSMPPMRRLRRTWIRSMRVKRLLAGPGRPRRVLRMGRRRMSRWWMRPPVVGRP